MITIRTGKAAVVVEAHAAAASIEAAYKTYCEGLH